MNDVDKILEASEPAAWERHRMNLSPSYMTKPTRLAFKAGFDAGLKFARIAAEEAGEVA